MGGTMDIVIQDSDRQFIRKSNTTVRLDILDNDNIPAASIYGTLINSDVSKYELKWKPIDLYHLTVGVHNYHTILIDNITGDESPLYLDNGMTVTGTLEIADDGLRFPTDVTSTAWIPTVLGATIPTTQTIWYSSAIRGNISRGTTPLHTIVFTYDKNYDGNITVQSTMSLSPAQANGVDDEWTTTMLFDNYNMITLPPTSILTSVAWNFEVNAEYIRVKVDKDPTNIIKKITVRT